MKVFYSPQVNTRRITYDIAGEQITATLDTGESDSFDFTDLPDGRAGEIETTLPFNPIVSAERIDGELRLELLNFIGINATEEERFPEWQEV